MVGIAKDKKKLREVLVGAGSIQKVSVARGVGLQRNVALVSASTGTPKGATSVIDLTRMGHVDRQAAIL